MEGHFQTGLDKSNRVISGAKMGMFSLALTAFSALVTIAATVKPFDVNFMPTLIMLLLLCV